jgi:outer membrane protein, heavy metal efflux system
LAAPRLAAGQPASIIKAERLTIDAALAEALDKNLELIATRAGVTIAQANLITAGLRPNLVISVGGDHLDVLGTGFSDENGAGPPDTARAWTFSWSAAANVRGASRWPGRNRRLPRRRFLTECAR